MNTIERVKFMYDFLTTYKQLSGPLFPGEERHVIPDMMLTTLTDDQLDTLRLTFEECADSVLFYQRKVEHERVAKEICQRLFTLAIEDGALPQQTDEQILGLEPVVKGFLKAGASTEEVWTLLHDEYQHKIKPRLPSMG